MSLASAGVSMPQNTSPREPLRVRRVRISNRSSHREKRIVASVTSGLASQRRRIDLPQLQAMADGPGAHRPELWEVAGPLPSA